jgi:hypothetical protein
MLASRGQPWAGARTPRSPPPLLRERRAGNPQIWQAAVFALRAAPSGAHKSESPPSLRRGSLRYERVAEP